MVGHLTRPMQWTAQARVLGRVGVACFVGTTWCEVAGEVDFHRWNVVSGVPPYGQGYLCSPLIGGSLGGKFLT